MIEITINENVRVEICPDEGCPVCILHRHGGRMFLTYEELAYIGEVVQEYLESAAEPRPGGLAEWTLRKIRGGAP